MTTPIDPYVEEIRAIRDAIAREFDYNIERLGEEMQAREARSGHAVVSLAPRRISPDAAGANQPPADRKSA